MLALGDGIESGHGSSERGDEPRPITPAEPEKLKPGLDGSCCDSAFYARVSRMESSRLKR